LISRGFKVVDSDFMKHTEEYDVIVANPPFSKQQDIDHVNKMMDIAKRRVVSVMSASVLFRDNKKTVAFRKRVEDLGGTFEELPEGTFKESGTNVRTCIVCVDI
jgi:predicted RNA methylase